MLLYQYWDNGEIRWRLLSYLSGNQVGQWKGPRIIDRGYDNDCLSIDVEEQHSRKADSLMLVTLPY